MNSYEHVLAYLKAVPQVTQERVPFLYDVKLYFCNTILLMPVPYVSNICLLFE